MARVLLIEPDRVLARIYGEYLRQAGHQTLIAATAQSAIHAADDVQPDIVVLEIQLVAHSGIEFLYEFRSYTDWQNIPVIVLSNVPPAEFNQSAEMLRHELGVQSYRYKPHTSLKQLLQSINATVHVA
jgi:DNA-binding response OmpR family regulator